MSSNVWSMPPAQLDPSAHISDPAGLAFWQTCFGRVCRVPFREFSQMYQLYLQQQCRVDLPVHFENVLRYCVTLHPPPPAASVEGNTFVEATEFNLFLMRFGPLHLSFTKAKNSFFEGPDLTVVPWFHGAAPRASASPSALRGVVGSFLVRFSQHHLRELTLVYARYVDDPDKPGVPKQPLQLEDRYCLIYNHGERGYALVASPDPSERLFADIQAFVSRNEKRLCVPVPSPLHTDCLQFVQLLKSQPTAPRPAPGATTDDSGSPMPVNDRRSAARLRAGSSALSAADGGVARTPSIVMPTPVPGTSATNVYVDIGAVPGPLATAATLGGGTGAGFGGASGTSRHVPPARQRVDSSGSGGGCGGASGAGPASAHAPAAPTDKSPVMAATRLSPGLRPSPGGANVYDSFASVPVPSAAGPSASGSAPPPGSAAVPSSYVMMDAVPDATTPNTAAAAPTPAKGSTPVPPHGVLGRWSSTMGPAGGNAYESFAAPVASAAAPSTTLAGSAPTALPAGAGATAAAVPGGASGTYQSFSAAAVAPGTATPACAATPPAATELSLAAARDSYNHVQAFLLAGGVPAGSYADAPATMVTGTLAQPSPAVHAAAAAAPEPSVDALLAAGREAFAARRLDDAVTAFAAAIRAAEAANDVLNRGRALANHGNVMKELGNLDEAVLSLQAAADLFQSLDDTRLLPYVLNSLCLALSDAGKLDQAVARCRQHLELLCRLSVPAGDVDACRERLQSLTARAEQDA